MKLMSIDDFEDSNPNFCPLIKGPLIQNRGLFITGAMVITGGLGITGASGCNRGITGASSPAGDLCFVPAGAPSPAGGQKSASV